MRKKLILLVALISLSALMVGCAAYAVSPVTGFLSTNVQAPLTATSSTGGYSKVGTAVCTSILGLIASGDASIQTAMKNGGIKKIHHVDYKSENILGIYAKYTTYVYGE